jgi:hypothetical protein
MIRKEQKLDPKSWQTCLLFLVLFAAWCTQADSRADEQPFRARLPDRLSGPRPAAEVASMETGDGARSTPPTDGPSPKKAALEPRANVPRPAPFNGKTRPYEEPIGPDPGASPHLSGDSRFDIPFARFLAKAGLSPMAVEALREIIKESPGKQAARDAQKVLDSIAMTK